MRNSLRNVICVCLYVCLAALLAFAAAAVWGQSANSGTITGVVVDNTNAVVPGATVSITQPATGAVRGTTTSDEGRYVFAFVDPGTYTVKVSKQGFTTTSVANVVVKVGLQVTTNVTLQVGAVSTTVTVEATPGSELQTLNATVGSTLPETMITNLPNVTRDVSTLAIFQPGQNINGNTGGVASDQNSFQLDGGFATDDMSGDNNTYIASFSGNPGGVGNYHSSGFNQSPSAVVPIPVSTVEEFKVSTANQTADFNGGAGSQMQVVTKRGTNTFHGTGYEYYLDSNFGGANTWDNNQKGHPQASSHFSRFGADAGGKIPGINVLGGGWYIFGGYEGFRFPSSSSFERSYPSPSLRSGLVKINLGGGKEEVINLNPIPMQDPALVAAGVAGGGPTFAAETGTIVDVTGTVINANDACSAGPCDPRAPLTGSGVNPVICASNGAGACAAGSLWSTIPLPNDYTTGDSSVPKLSGTANALYSTRALVANTGGYLGNIARPQKSNFTVARIDHDFAKNEHFNATYHYYKLTNTVSDQTDVGGIFAGDTFGQYKAIRQKPQNPWLYTAGLTTDVSSNVTNDIHFSYTRNWWAYLDPSGVPNLAGMPAALEMGGETSGAFQPYNTNNQSTRYRYWNGHDFLVRDDVTWIKGNHLFQLGGSWLRNRDTHLRNDNGESINTFEQYIIGDGTGTELSGLGIDMSAFTPGSLGGSRANKYGDYYSMITGMIDQTQSLFTRGLGTRITGLPLDPRTSCAIASVASTVNCVASPPLVNSSIIPTYNTYITDSWHIRPSVSLNYGLGYTVEMPPYETNGGFQTVLVDQNGSIQYARQYLNNERAAALQGLGYAPLLGFSAVRNVPNHSHYPYDPYFGGISPRIGIAWNFRPDTVIRGAYSRIFGRINGVNPVLVPMLTPGLMQPAICTGPAAPGNANTCGNPGTLNDPTNVFRVGLDCPGFSSSSPCVAPLPAPSANLPQPWYPGFNDVATGTGETIDPNFHPNRSDEFTFSVQHQFGPKILAEAGYIGRLLGNEIQYYSFTAVPYMLTQGGQTFANAWANVMVASNYGTNFTLGSGSNLPAQPFFEAALGGAGSAYCSGVAGATNCTQAFVSNNASNMNSSDVYSSWASISNGGFLAPSIGRTFTSDPVNSPFGASGQSPTLLTTISDGYGNYNGGYLQLTFTDWHGLTLKSNFQYSNALGTGDVVQASSSYTSVDNWNIHNMYGPQYYNEKFTLNFFVNYAPTFYASQKGLMGRLLGGWSVSPLFTYGSGFPVEMNTLTDCNSFGECNSGLNISTFENGIITQNLRYTGTRKIPTDNGTCGNSNVFNVFSDVGNACPQDALGGNGIFAANDPVRQPILGLDGQIGGGGPVKGLPFWNLDLGITKNIKILERVNSNLYFDFTNVANHMQAADPCFFLGDQADWGVLGCGGNVQGNQPRRLQLGLSFNW